MPDVSANEHWSPLLNCGCQSSLAELLPDENLKVCFFMILKQNDVKNS
jgi:hypothetical protein